jgi:cyclase
MAPGKLLIKGGSMLKWMMPVVLVCLTTGLPATTQGNDLADTTFAITRVNDHIYVVEGRVGLPVNFVVSVGVDGVLLVDAGYTGTADLLRPFLDSLTDGPIRYVIVTHPHDDHYSGNKAFGSEVCIIADSTAAVRMSASYFALPSLPGTRRVDVAVANDTALSFNGEGIRLIHVPRAHTDGDLMVFFSKSKVLCAGDLVFADMIPFVDLSIGGNVQNYVANIKHLIDTLPPDITIVPGHGRNYTREDLKVFYEMLAYTTNKVAEARSQNRTAEQVLQDPQLSRWVTWNGTQRITQMDYWIPCIFRSLEGTTSVSLPSICAPLTEAIVRDGIDSALALYHRLKQTEPDRYDFGETQLNILGYELMNRQMMPQAGAIFGLNCSEHPESGNAYDSMGEFFMTTGQKDRAIEFYRKSLEKSPDNSNAVEMLKKLNSGQ